MKDSRLQVLFVINSLDGGGAEKQLLLLATALARHGFQCVLFTLQDRPMRSRYEQLWATAKTAGVEWVRGQSRRGFDAAQIFRIHRRLARDRRSVLWSWGHRAEVAAMISSFLRPSVRRVCSLRDADEARIIRHRWWWRILVQCNDVLVSNSELNVEQLERHARGASAKARVIRNGILPEDASLEWSRPPLGAGRLRVVMLGNILIHKKGYDLAVRLAACFKAAGLPWEIAISGTPVEGERLQLLMREHGVEDVIRLEGPTERPLKFLQQGHVFLMTSRYEGIPNALLEAMSLGLPCVCTRVGDVPKFAEDRVHLRLVDIADAEAAFDAIQDLGRNWREAVAMGERGRELCHRLFSIARMTSDVLALLRNLQAREGVR